MYTAHQLLNKYNFKSEEIAVLEARRGVGGRLVTTTHDVKNGDTPAPKFNDFAWRIGEKLLKFGMTRVI